MAPNGVTQLRCRRLRSVVPATNHTGLVEEGQADPGHGTDVRAVPLDSGEPLDRDVLAPLEHHVLLRDAPEQGVRVHLVRDQDGQTRNHDAFVDELEQRLVATGPDLELAQGLSDSGTDDPRVSVEPSACAA